MSSSNVVELVGVHAEGEIGRILIKGAPAIPGETLRDKMNYINNVDDSLMKFCLYEPRGSANMTVNVMFEPTIDGADVAFIPLQPDGAHAISGSNCICVATTALEMGMVTMQEPVSHVLIETPAGLVNATANCRAGKCVSVTVKMAPSFVERLDHLLDLPGGGQLLIDVAYGGCYFVLVDAQQIDISLETAEARRLVELALLIKSAASEQVKIEKRPGVDICRIEYVMFTSVHDGKLVNCNIIHPGRVDRSPCGTGSGARLAVMHARGEVAVGQEVLFYSLIGSRFDCRIVEEHQGENPGVTHEITGRAWRFSHETVWSEPSDPYPSGYVLSDIWGPEA